MRWTLHYDPGAFKELAKLDKGIQRNIKDYLAEICHLDDPAARGHGLTGPWAGFRARQPVGQWLEDEKFAQKGLAALRMKAGLAQKIFG